MSLRCRLRSLCLLGGIAVAAPASAYGQANSPAEHDATTAIADARRVFRESERALARGAWTRSDTKVLCDSERPAIEARIHRDSVGVIRRLEWSGGSDDHAETHRYFYDARGQLRFAFFTLGAVNGTEYEERVYYGTRGQVSRRISRLVKGPGYSIRHEVGIHDASAWRRIACR